MSNVPQYLKGRGRGRGRGGRPPGSEKPTELPRGREAANKPGFNQSNHSFSSNVKNGDTGQFDNDVAEKRFQEASYLHQQAIQQHLKPQLDSVADADDDGDDIADIVLTSVFKTYTNTFSDNTENGHPVVIDKAQEDLVHSFRSGASACLICIETIKKNDAIWNCSCCFAMFHIQCVQKWVKEGIYQHAYKSENMEVSKDMPWHCPKCRSEFSQRQCPTRYYCFCGKEQDPNFDPWLVPHSCGQTCGRNLKPECGHKCLLLCHPGPCPPCPKTISATCHCRKQKPKICRCSAKMWSCGMPCGQRLSCGQHNCQLPCHSGECPPCPKTSNQFCLCGKAMTNRPCASPQWQCDEPCGKKLDCGSHRCENICHAGKCGACPRSGARQCPCGKSDFDLPCTEDVPTCGDTCAKMLDCGIHSCSQRCHTGPCGTCRQMAVKTCKCGQRQKEVPCYKEYLCEVKCSKTKDCGRHQCKRKCCDGNCPSCEQICGKMLSCKNHKCASRCHRGPCYPCPLTVDITCFCKATHITVPCGKEKVTKPPRCNHPCKKPPLCHHSSQIPHRCHFGDCPPCRLICNKQLDNCDHSCPASCHTAVKTIVKDNVARAGPWEGRPTMRQEIQKKPCPPCAVHIPIQCLGKHETSNMKCSELREYSCGRKCGRQLECKNHTCTKDCHLVTNAVDKSQHGDTCEQCESECLKVRPTGCSHSCSILKCHPGDCPPCKQMVRMRCHCQVSVQHVKCSDWMETAIEKQEQLKSCGGECPKTLTCGHPCGALCHAGECPMGKCEKKVVLRCKCRRKKKDSICKELINGKVKLECDEVCQQEMEKKRQDNEEKEKAKNEEEQRKREAELEEFERKMKGRKRKPRKEQKVEEKVAFMSKYKKWIVLPVVIVVLAVFAFYLINQ